MRVLASLALVFLAGCNSTPPQRMTIDDYEPAYVNFKEPHKQNGSLFTASSNINPFGEETANQVGDVVTVMLTENMSASKSASSNSSKSTETNLNPVMALGNTVTTGKLGGTDLSLGLSSDNGFSGTGGASQSNNVAGTIAVTVHKVLPNGNLWVKGEKWIKINSGEELVQLSGVIRPKDIDSQNRIESTKIADARIVYSGEGFIKEASDPGLLFKLFNNSWWPF